jgi:hypothetical protein
MGGSQFAGAEITGSGIGHERFKRAAHVAHRSGRMVAGTAAADLLTPAAQPRQLAG